MPDDLTLDEIRTLQDQVGPTAYQQRVIALFRSGRATAAQWQALSEAVLLVSESSAGHLVLAIDRAVLAGQAYSGDATHA